jgi:hypothetical protein
LPAVNVNELNARLGNCADVVAVLAKKKINKMNSLTFTVGIFNFKKDVGMMKSWL